MVLVMQPWEMQHWGDHENLGPGFQKVVEVRQSVAKLQFLQGVLAWPLYETVKMKPKLQWRLQDTGDARTFAKESCMMQDSRLKRLSVPKERSWRAGLHKPFGAQMIPSQAPDPIYAAVECHLPCRLSALLWSQHSLLYLSSLFWNGNVCSVPLYIGRM